MWSGRRARLGGLATEDIGIDFYDPLPFYQSLRKSSVPATLDLVTKLHKEPLKGSPNNFSLALIHLILMPELDVCFVENSTLVQDSKNIWGEEDTGLFDGVFDLCVENATYARLICSQSKSDMCPWNNCGFIEFKKENDVFKLPDVTYEAPLFPTRSGATFKIETDGDRIRSKGIVMQLRSKNILYEFSPKYVISHIKDKFILMGELWMPSVILNRSELVKVS